jgi:hypothetical protein
MKNTDQMLELKERIEKALNTKGDKEENENHALSDKCNV